MHSIVTGNVKVELLYLTYFLSYILLQCKMTILNLAKVIMGSVHVKLVPVSQKLKLQSWLCITSVEEDNTNMVTSSIESVDSFFLRSH